MAHVFVACPKCGAAYKMAKEHLSTPAVCRSCGHRWVPAAPAAEPPESPAPAEAAAPAAEPPEPPAPAEPAVPAPAPPSAPSAPVDPNAADPKGLNGEMGSPLDALAAMAAAADSHKGDAEAVTPEAVTPEAVTPEPVTPEPAPVAAKPAAPKPPAPKPSAPAAPAVSSGGKEAAFDALAAMAQAARGEAPSAPAASPPATPAPADKAVPKPAAPKPDPLVTRHINGFKIQQRVGTGGFGVVYRAFDTNLERSVAIKMLPPNLAKAGKGVVQRFLREARSAAKLAHPNIVTIHQICPYEDTYYIVMELVEGGTLHEQLAKQRMSPDEATSIIRSAAEGLSHAHKRGIIHRDIKPGNIMLTRDGQVKVSDFGLARDVLQGHDIVGAGHSLGTPRYMAPEQALGEEPTAASDLYSLAATYYVLLTGRSAFDGPGDREIMRKQVQDPVPDPRTIRPDLPVSVFRFFEKAMAKQPEDRYTTAEAFIEALGRLDFSRAGADLSDSEDLVDQLGSVSAEDRGSHLTQTLGRAVRRAQRQRTPVAEIAVGDLLGAGTAAGKKAGWKLWVIIGVAALLVIGSAVTAAILLAPGRGGTGDTEPKPPPPETPGVETPATPGTTIPGETPGTPPVAPPPAPAESPLEAVAKEVLDEVQAYEADLDTPVYELIRMYRENVMQVYPGTKAAKVAEAAVKRLQGGKRLNGGSPPPTEEPPPKETPADEKPADEKPADEKPADEKPADEKPAEATPPA